MFGIFRFRMSRFHLYRLFFLIGIICIIMETIDQLREFTAKHPRCTMYSECHQNISKVAPEFGLFRSEIVNREKHINHFKNDAKYRQEEKQRNRVGHLREKCKELGLKKDLDISKLWKGFFFVNHKYKFVYCAMPKVGCTFMKRLLFVLDGKTQSKNPYSIPAKWAHNLPLDAFSTFNTSNQNIENYLKYYKKVIFVRDPIKRLVSGYTDKISSVRVPLWSQEGKPIIKSVRKNPTEIDLKCGHNASFQEFLDYRIKQEEVNQRPNMHFDLMYRTCHPCMIDYDFVGKIESFNNDVNYLLDVVNIDENVTFTEKFDAKMDYVRDVVYTFKSNIDGAKNCGMDFNDYVSIFWQNLVQKNVIPPRKTFPTIHDNVTAAELNEMIGKLKEDIHDGSEKVNLIDTVSRETMSKIQELYKFDFELMGYDKYVK